MNYLLFIRELIVKQQQLFIKLNQFNVQSHYAPTFQSGTLVILALIFFQVPLQVREVKGKNVLRWIIKI